MLSSDWSSDVCSSDRGNEPNLGFALPGATQSEYRAALLWSMRAGLNVAALQCQFEPTLLTLSNYNAMIAHHDDELANAFSQLTSYFKRGEGKSGQNEIGRASGRGMEGSDVKIRVVA